MQPRPQHKISDLTYGTIFKIVFLAGLCMWALVAAFSLLIAFLSPESVTVNGVQATNFLQAVSIIPFIAILGGFFSLICAALSAFALKLLAKSVPLGPVSFEPLADILGSRR